MRKSIKLSTVILSLSMLLLAACSEDKPSETSAGSKDSNEEATSPKESEGKNLVSESGGILNPNIAKEAEGNVELIYTNEEPNFVHDMNGFKVSVDKYQIVKVTDMNNDFSYDFDDQREGYVITAKVTVDNTTDKAQYYTLMSNIRLTSESDYLPGRRTFVYDEYPKSATESDASEWSAGEKVTGLISFTLTNDEFNLLSTVKPKFIIEAGVADNKDFSGSYKEEGVFDFTYSTEQAKEVAKAHNFYPDGLTTTNMADKVLIFEKMNLNEIQQLGDVKVTLEGLQYTEIKPTSGNEERFRNFGDSGIVALTVKFKVDNQSKEKVKLDNISSKLMIDKDRAITFSQGMVEPSEPRAIEAGKQGEKYHVFLFRKDEFEIYKTFELEFGPFTKEDGQKQFKGKSVKFLLPR